MDRSLACRAAALLPALLLFVPGPAAAQQTPSPPGARVYFIDLDDGAVVSSPVRIRFGLSGMGIAPANHDGGDAHRNTGHHHLMINLPPLSGDALRSPIPTDDQHRHFGGRKTENVLSLPPGCHTLQLALADWMHFPHDPPVLSERISITVR